MPDVPADDIDVPPPKKRRRSSLPAMGAGCAVGLVALLALAGVAALLVGPGWLRYHRERQRQEELAGCGGNLRKIHAECSRAAESSGRFPEDLIAMGQNVPGSAQCCPVTGRRYVYLAGRDLMMREFVLAHEDGARAHGEDGFHVLYAGGRLELWPPSRWEKLKELVADQERVVAAAGKSAKAGDAAMLLYRRRYRTPEYYDEGKVPPHRY